MTGKLLKLFKSNFLKLLSATIVGVLFGLVYRVSVAWLFGSSEDYAFYLIMSISLAFFIQFVGQTALEGNLVPDLTKAVTKNEKVSFRLLKKDTLFYSLIFGFINFLIVLAIVFVSKGEIDLYYLFIAFLLGLALFVYIFNSVGLMVTQAKGNYKVYSRAMIANAITRGGSVYPLGYAFGIIGVAINKFLCFFVLFFGGWYQINKQEKDNSVEKEAYSPRISLKSFNIISLFLANYYSFFIMVAGILFGINGDVKIANFSYATAILGLVINTIGKASNTLLIRETSISYNFKRVRNFLFMVLGISLLFISVMWFYGKEIVSVIYERGAFSESDTFVTYDIIIKLFLPFIFLSVFGVVLQTILSADKKILKVFRKVCGLVIFILMASLITLLLVNIVESLTAVYLFFYLGSFILLITAIYFSYRRLKSSDL